MNRMPMGLRLCGCGQPLLPTETVCYDCESKQDKKNFVVKLQAEIAKSRPALN